MAVKVGRRSEEKEEVGLLKRRRHGKGKGKRERQAYWHGRIRFQLPDDRRRQYVLLLPFLLCFVALLFRYVRFVLCRGVPFMYAEFVRWDGRISGLQVCLFKFSRLIDSLCFPRRRV